MAATKKPKKTRITVDLSPEDYQTIQDWVAEEGYPAAQILRQVLRRENILRTLLKQGYDIVANKEGKMMIVIVQSRL